MTRGQKVWFRIEIIVCFGPWVATVFWGLLALPTYVAFVLVPSTRSESFLRDSLTYFGLMTLGIVACIGLFAALRLLSRGTPPERTNLAQRVLVFVGLVSFCMICVVAMLVDLFSALFLPTILATAHIAYLLRKHLRRSPPSH